MSFEKLSEEELLSAAEMLAVDLETSKTKTGRVNPKLAAAAFAEEGVTWDLYTAEVNRVNEAKAALEEEQRKEEELERARLVNTIKAETVNGGEVEPEADEVVTVRKPRGRSTPTDILVKMDRQNPHYEVCGKVFTKDHPFVLMSEVEAQRIFDTEHGFRVATPREASEYYS